MKNIHQLRDAGYTAREHCDAIYMPGYVKDGTMQQVVWQSLLDLEWITKRTARHEYFMSLEERTYSYGNKGTGEETYHSKPFTSLVRGMMLLMNAHIGADFNVCFLNKYDDHHQHLGWHADNFPGMREEEPIAVLSFGAEREIWTRPKKLEPVPGMLPVANPGACAGFMALLGSRMQDLWRYRHGGGRQSFT